MPPEGPALKYLWREGKKHVLLFWADEGIGPYEFYYGSKAFPSGEGGSCVPRKRETDEGRKLL